MALSQLATATPVAEPATAVSQTAARQEIVVPELIMELGTAYGVDTRLALKIARCESNLQQFSGQSGQVVRGRANAYDVGVFQINELYHLEKSQTLDFDIETAEGNIEYAMWLMKNEGTRHWVWSKPCWSK